MIGIGPKRMAALALLAIDASGAPLRAQDANVNYVQENGMTYRVTRQVVKHPVTETHVETRESTSYQNKLTTEIQTTPRTFPVAITEYHWVPVYRRSWNIFAPPYLTYELVPQTRWETHSDTVQTPITRSELVPVKVTQQVPVVTQRYVDGEIVSKVPVGSTSGATTTASLAASNPGAGAPASATVADRSAIGGIYQLDNDPPRAGASWRPATTDTLRR